MHCLVRDAYTCVHCLVCGAYTCVHCLVRGAYTCVHCLVRGAYACVHTFQGVSARTEVRFPVQGVAKGAVTCLVLDDVILLLCLNLSIRRRMMKRPGVACPSC